MGSSSFLVCGGRGSIAAVSDEVLQWECMQLQSLWELQRNLWETTEKFMGAGFFGVEAEQHVSSFYGISIKKVYGEPERAGPMFGPRCRLLCLVYIQCLFCEASGTSSIGCFVCDLHRFSIKLKWECETLENLVRVLQVHYENGLCTPPS